MHHESQLQCVSGIAASVQLIQHRDDWTIGAKLHILNILQVNGLETETNSSWWVPYLSPWRQIIIKCFQLLYSYPLCSYAKITQNHTLSSKVGTNKAATNNFIFECTPFLLFNRFWVEANICYIGHLHLQLNSSGPGSQRYYFRHRDHMTVIRQ